MPHFTTADGLNLAYDVTGAGVPLLCLPGLTRNMADFDPVVAAFADQAQIIRLDFRGRGGSDYGDPATYQIPQEAHDTLALLDHLGLSDALVLGTSRGGLVAMAIAATVPQRLRGVIFNDIGPEIMAEGLAYIMDYLGKEPRFQSFDEAALGMAHHYAPAFEDVPPATWQSFVRAIFIEENGRLKNRYDPRLREAVAPAFEPGAVAPDLWPFFDALAGKPLGLIRGVNSNILSSETAAEMCRRRPDMVFADIEKRGHVPFLDEPEAQSVIATVLEACQ